MKKYDILLNRNDVVNNARLVGKSFSYEEAHAMQVRKLSAMLFDQLERLHKIGEPEKMLLELASILHDVGAINGREDHNIHSQNIIIESEDLGIDRRQRIIVGLVARYHRRDFDESNSYFLCLNENEKNIVKKLASIIRLADGLDKGHLSIVDGVECKILDKSVEIHLSFLKNIPCYFTDLRKKSDLFRDTFKKYISVIM